METLQETLLHRQYRFDTGYIVLGISDSLFYSSMNLREDVVKHSPVFRFNCSICENMLYNIFSPCIFHIFILILQLQSRISATVRTDTQRRLQQSAVCSRDIPRDCISIYKHWINLEIEKYEQKRRIRRCAANCGIRFFINLH